MRFIWQRYFIKEIFKTFILCISAFAFLYILVDYAAHTKAFQHTGITIWHILVYYFCEITCQSDLLVPVAFLLSCVKVLTTAQMRYETIALCAGGISIKKILSPFIYSACFFALFIYCNFQFLHPVAAGYLYQFETQHFKDHDLQTPSAHAITLVDNSLFIYQAFNPSENSFFDTYWIKNSDEVYHMQLLYPYEEIPKGITVDHLKRNEEGKMYCVASYEESSITGMQFEPQTLKRLISSPKGQSISELYNSFNWKELTWRSEKVSDREAEILCSFFYKLMIPSICLLSAIAPASFCFVFSRKISLFPIYACALCGILSFFTLLNSAVILGEFQIIPPLYAIFAIPAGLFLIFGWRYAKL